MSEERDMQWYVVHTYSGHENKVKTTIENTVKNRGMENIIEQVIVPTEDVVTTTKTGKENVQVSEKKVGFIKGTGQELRKVTWPTVGELAGKTGVVLGVVIVSTLFVWLVDLGLSKALSLLIK